MTFQPPHVKLYPNYTIFLKKLPNFRKFGAILQPYKLSTHSFQSDLNSINLNNPLITGASLNPFGLISPKLDGRQVLGIVIFFTLFSTHPYPRFLTAVIKRG